MTYSTAKIDYPGVAGKCYLVTGASGGIGSECAKLLDSLGATVICNGRNEERLQQTINAMDNRQHIAAPGDLNEMDLPVWLAEQVERTGLPLAGIAHCAGTHLFSPLRAFAPNILQKTLTEYTVMTASLFHAVCTCKNRASQCSLAFMSSSSAREGVPGNALYGAARAAMESLCRSFAVEFSAQGIRCNAVSAGFMHGSVMTGNAQKLLGTKAMDRIAGLYPLGLGHVSDAANALVFLLGSASRWITGTILILDGGLAIKG